MVQTPAQNRRCWVSYPFCISWVPKLCLNVCVLTSLSIFASRAHSELLFPGTARDLLTCTARRRKCSKSGRCAKQTRQGDSGELHQKPDRVKGGRRESGNCGNTSSPLTQAYEYATFATSCCLGWIFQTAGFGNVKWELFQSHPGKKEGFLSNSPIRPNGYQQ
jgi:hypothetical protein